MPNHGFFKCCVEMTNQCSCSGTAGKTTTVRDFCEMAFIRAGMPLHWEGEGVNEVSTHVFDRVALLHLIIKSKVWLGWNRAVSALSQDLIIMHGRSSWICYLLFGLCCCACLTLGWVVCCCLQRGIVVSGEHAGKTVVKVSERFFRPAEVELLLGDPAKAREVLGWDPDKMTSVEKLCEEMVDSDIELAKMELAKNDLKKKLKVCNWRIVSCPSCIAGLVFRCYVHHVANPGAGGQRVYLASTAFVRHSAHIGLTALFAAAVAGAILI